MTVSYRLLMLLICAVGSTHVPAQTVTIIGTPHLTGLEVAPSAEQRSRVIDALAAFEPSQVCVERMGGALIEKQMADAGVHGMTLQPETHGRHLADRIIPAGIRMQAELEIRPRDARAEASRLASSSDRLDNATRIRIIALQIAGFEFHSAVLNWTYFDKERRRQAEELLPPDIVQALDTAAESVHEVYSLAVPLARRFGLRALCTADVLADESTGMRTALKHGGQAILELPEVKERIDEYNERMDSAWQPEQGPAALLSLLRFTNSDDFALMDRRLQWETLREFDNEQGAFRRRLMYWHARTAEISAELHRALAQGPEERVMLIIGAAHRPFSEADMRAQPWVKVLPAASLLETNKGK